MRPPVTPFDIASHVRAAAGGAQHGYAWLYRTFAPLVHSIHLGMAPRALADELVQDTFALAFARLHHLREAHKFGPWIAAIARRNRPRVSPFEHPAVDGIDAAGDTTAPDASAEAERVLRAIRALPEAYRETLLLRLVEGMSGPEIAALTGLTPASVRVNLHRGMAKLRASLGLAHEEVSDGIAS